MINQILVYHYNELQSNELAINIYQYQMKYITYYINRISKSIHPLEHLEKRTLDIVICIYCSLLIIKQSFITQYLYQYFQIFSKLIEYGSPNIRSLLSQIFIKRIGNHFEQKEQDSIPIDVDTNYS